MVIVELIAQADQPLSSAKLMTAGSAPNNIAVQIRLN